MAAKYLESPISLLIEVRFEWFKVWFWSYGTPGVCWNILLHHWQIILMIKIQNGSQITKYRENLAAIE